MSQPRFVSRCTTCQRQIVFLLTATGNKMPVDAHSVTDARDRHFDGAKGHSAHWRTCDAPDLHRKPKPPAPPAQPTLFD